MRPARVIILAWMMLLLQSAHAQEASISAVELAGTWSVLEMLPDGALMTVELSLMHNRTFSGIGTLVDESVDAKPIDRQSKDGEPTHGVPFWTCSGSWQVKGKQVVWNYVNSSRPLSDSAKADTDDIISLEASRLVLVSRSTGKRREFSRLKPPQ